MSDNQIPESISLEALAALQAEAPKEESPEPKGDGPFDGLTKGQLIDAAEDMLQASLEKCGDPMIHKVMALSILSKMILWHTKMGSEEATGDSSIAWLRDGGKLQAAMQILSSVSFGPDDFIAAMADD